MNKSCCIDRDAVVDPTLKELKDKGENVIEVQLYTDMLDRDKRDREREISPLIPAKDAWILDTTLLDANQALDAALFYVTDKSN